MRVALITFVPEGDRSSSAIVSKLESGSTSRGNQVEVINGYRDLMNTRLSVFDYVAVVVRTKGLFNGKVPSRVAEFLSTSGSIAGRKGCALVAKSGFSSGKTCKELMKIMEREGVKLDYFDIIADEEQAPLIGKKIG